MSPTPDPFAQLLELAMPATYLVAVAAMVLEFVVLRRMGEPRDRRGARASLLSGLFAFGGLALANRVLFIGLMQLAWQHRIIDLGGGATAWLAGFVLYDFMFYVAHRLGHQLRVLWCFHSVHHSSEQMRLTSAIRGSAFDFVYLPWFFVWLPLMGLHPSLVLIVEATARIWGVLVHVHPRLVGRLRALDRVIVTPSVHRVHHGRDPRYLDRNYGEVLTLWDQLFGSFEPEQHPPDYGLLKPVDAGDLAAIQLGPWQDLWADLRRAPTLRVRLRYLFDAPGYSHDGPDQRARGLRPPPE